MRKRRRGFEESPPGLIRFYGKMNDFPAFLAMFGGTAKVERR
jgi:hypothetical protein